VKKIAKLGVVAFLLLLIISPVVYAQNIWGDILGLFSLKFLQDTGMPKEQAFAAFVRLVLWIALFSVFSAVGKAIPGLAGRAGTIVGLAIATISAIFIPSKLLITVGELYSTVLLWILFGSLILGLIWFHFKILSGDSTLRIGIRIVSLLLILAILQKINVATQDFFSGARPYYAIVVYHPVIAAAIKKVIRKVKKVQ
jgi:hypothetical protein